MFATATLTSRVVQLSDAVGVNGGKEKMLYGAMNFPIRPVLQELEVISESWF